MLNHLILKDIKMKVSKKLGRLRFLIHKYGIFVLSDRDDLLEKMNYTIISYSKVKSQKKRLDGLIELRLLLIELSVTSDEYYHIFNEERRKFANLRENTSKETRDNKGVYAGNGGSNQNKIRYPKKNRSRKTWATFYEMFPYRAKVDGWDGKTSKRYPR